MDEGRMLLLNQWLLQNTHSFAYRALVSLDGVSFSFQMKPRTHLRQKGGGVSTKCILLSSLFYFTTNKWTINDQPRQDVPGTYVFGQCVECADTFLSSH